VGHLLQGRRSGVVAIRGGRMEPSSVGKQDHHFLKGTSSEREETRGLSRGGGTFSGGGGARRNEKMLEEKKGEGVSGKGCSGSCCQGEW